ncbi:SOUL hem-binding protein [Baffinella frigidus]|nr:SOUL hem-binding protein [Cryptophyta sp. CCMP2293]
MIRARNQPTMAEMILRTPEGLETPKYEVLAEMQGFEVREYAEFTVCSTPMGTGFSAFESLAGYVFGKNQEEKKMAMTTPVISSPDGQKMSFIMPSSFWADTKGAPTPLATAAVKVEGKGGGMLAGTDTLACMWFGGYTTKDEVVKRKKALREALAKDAAWEVADASSEPVLLQYNDPFVPPWRRRNEVALTVKRRAVPEA